MKCIYMLAGALSFAAVTASCDSSKHPRVETYYVPAIVEQPTMACSNGFGVMFRLEPSGPMFSVLPQRMDRKRLAIMILAGGPDQPDASNFNIACQSALLTTSGSRYPPTGPSNMTVSSPCETEPVLKTNNIQAHSVSLEFVAATDLADVVTLKLPEVRSIRTGTLYPSTTVELHKFEVPVCPDVPGFR